MAIIESIRLEGEETNLFPKNKLINYLSPLYGDNQISPIFSNEPVYLLGEDEEEYLLLGEDEDGSLVYGFENDSDQNLLVFADYDGNIKNYATLDGFGFGGLMKGLKMPKMKFNASKLPKIKFKPPRLKFNTKGITKGFSGISKGLSKGVSGISKGISSGVKAYGKAWTDVGKGLSKGAGQVLSQVAESGMNLLNPDGQAQEEEQSEEEQPEEEYSEEEQSEEEQSEEEQPKEEYSESEGTELGFLQFLPMATGLLSTVASGVQKKQQAKKTAKNQRTTALLSALKQANTKPIVKKNPATQKIKSIKIPSQGVARASAPSPQQQQEVPTSTNKTIMLVGGGAVVLLGAMFYLNKKGKRK